MYESSPQTGGRMSTRKTGTGHAMRGRNVTEAAQRCGTRGRSLSDGSGGLGLLPRDVLVEYCWPSLWRVVCQHDHTKVTHDDAYTVVLVVLQCR